MSIQVHVKDTIYKSVSEVYDAIVNPEKIVGYFVSSASEAISEGKTIRWEFKDYNVEFDIEIQQVIPEELISFEWIASGIKALVEIKLVPQENDRTQIEITERSYESSHDALKKALQQTQGWTDFICSLKAYMYTGINLRTGKMN